jgi:hypothetical protein
MITSSSTPPSWLNAGWISVGTAPMSIPIVRFIQLYSGGGPVSVQWDVHKDLVGNYEKMCGMTDLPVAGLIRDLKQRGLLESTLAIWGAEFGRLPMSQGGDGRDHNQDGFTTWFAGGGVKPGTIIGETDEMGLPGFGTRYSMRDFHATILQLLGLDQNRLWFLHKGRNEKLTKRCWRDGGLSIGAPPSVPGSH